MKVDSTTLIHHIVIISRTSTETRPHPSHRNHRIQKPSPIKRIVTTATHNTCSIILRVIQNGHHLADDIFNVIFANANFIEVCIGVPFDNKAVLVQIMAWCLAGDKPLFETMMAYSSMMYMCTQSQCCISHKICTRFSYAFVLLWLISSVQCKFAWHDDVIKWKYFPRYWPFMKGIHRWPVISPHTKANDAGLWSAPVYSTVCSGADQRKHQSSAILAFVREIPRWLVNPPPPHTHTHTHTQRASNVENVSIWWRHHELLIYASFVPCQATLPFLRLGYYKFDLENSRPMSWVCSNGKVIWFLSMSKKSQCRMRHCLQYIAHLIICVWRDSSLLWNL